MKREEIIPSAARLTNSLRDLGYEFVNAVADLIDNSINAGARRVNITIHIDGPDSWVRTADDGEGMTGSSISEAMRLGTARDYGEADLGKFGLGLKTASLSQCRMLTVASRTDPQRTLIEARRLDLDHVTETDKWEILIPASSERSDALTAPLRSSTGTVVMWESLDRVLNFRDPWGSWAQKHLLQLAERLEFHLGMVFGRFIAGEAQHRRKLTITLNGNTVEPWDPFVRQEPKVEHLPEHDFRIGSGIVRFRPYVLPAQRNFSSDAAWRRASGPRQWNRQQGFYIYRADRMIQSGGWSHMRAPDEHTKLARAAVEFWPDLDDDFEINISKMRVRLPEELRDRIGQPVTQLIRRAEEQYRGDKNTRRPSRQASPNGPATPAPTRTTGPQPTPSPPRTGSGEVGDPKSGSTTGPPPNVTTQQNGGRQPRTEVGISLVDTEESTPAEALQRAADRVGQGPALDMIREEMLRTEREAARELGW